MLLHKVSLWCWHTAATLRISPLSLLSFKCQAEGFGLDVSLEMLGTFARIWPAEECGGIVFGKGLWQVCAPQRRPGL